MRTLPDHLRKGMKLVIVGCNPSESSVRVGHYYAGRSNEFWPILYESGVVPEPFDYHDDRRVIEFGIGLNHTKRYTLLAMFHNRYRLPPCSWKPGTRASPLW